MKRLTTLALVAAFAVACSSNGADTGGVSGTTSGAPDAQTVTVGMNDALAFVPDTINAKVGTVTFDVSNLGRVPHNLHFSEEALGKTGTIDGKKAEPLTVTFTTAGTFTFVCTFHSRMTGKAVVTG